MKIVFDWEVKNGIVYIGFNTPDNSMPLIEVPKEVIFRVKEILDGYA